MIRKKTNKKRQFYKYFSIILLVGGGFVFLFLLFLGRQQDIENTTKMAEETISFLKGACKRYDNYHIGIDANATQDVLDKSQILREYMDKEILEDNEALLKFAKLQNLTGILVVDQNLEMIAQADICSKNPSHIFKELIHNETKNNILTNSNKVYSDKMKIGTTNYHVAMVSRKDKKGIILCYKDAKQLNTDKYSYSFSALLENNTFHGNPKILITDNKSVLASNAIKLKGVNDTKDLPSAFVTWYGHRLTKIKFNGKTLYGMRQVYDKYYIYVCYESAEMFSDLVPVVTIGVAVYIFFFMCLLLVRQNMREQNIMEQARQIETIKAISSLYVSTALLNLETKQCMPIQYSKRLEKTLKQETQADKIISILVRLLIAPKYKEGFAYFISPENIEKRMREKKESIAYIYQDINEKWIITYIIPAQFKENGDVKVVVIATRDIDEYQKKEMLYQEELKKTAEDAKLANAAKTTFLRRMSHDIRTPINGIRGMATLAKNHLEEPGKEAEYIDKIIISSDYLLDLVNDVLQMNKLESGKIYLEHRSFDMRQLVKETVELCKLQAEEQDIKMSLKKLKTEHAHLIGSPVHLRQIAQNLITNAIRYNHAGGTVDITWEEVDFDGEYATYQFICADTGNGMSEEFQKHLYEPFAQENDDGRSTYTGTGLGLPIVKQLVEHMGGSIHFISKKGKGTTFTVTMKIMIDANYKRQVEEDIDLGTISIHGVKILLVEDNEINMQIAKELLEANGAVITKAHNGKEAVKIFEASEEGTFDVILMDVMMPEMDGLDATRYIRALKRQDASEIPIFAMTANAFIEDINQSKEAGMNEHFSKPLNMEDVIKTICKYQKK